MTCAYTLIINDIIYHYKQYIIVVIIAQLKRSFNNPTAARDAIVRQFRARVTIDSLRQLLLAFDAALDALKQLKLKDKSHEPRIATAVMSQVPAELQLAMNRLPKKFICRIRERLDRELKGLESGRDMYHANSPPPERFVDRLERSTSQR